MEDEVVDDVPVLLVDEVVTKLAILGVEVKVVLVVLSLETSIDD